MADWPTGWHRATLASVLASVAVTAAATGHASAASTVFLPTVVRRAIAAESWLHPISHVGGEPRAVVADGRRGWAGIGPRVVAFRMGPDERLAIAGASDVLPGIVQDVALRGDHLYASVRVPRAAADGPSGDDLYAFDVGGDSPPRLAAVLGERDGRLDHLAASGPTLFGADDCCEAVAFDIADPGRPRPLGRFELPSRGHPEILDVVARADHLYVLQHDFRWPDPSPLQLLVLDVSDPSAASLGVTVPIGTDASGFGDGLHLDGERLYWLGGPVVVLSLADPARPEIVPNALVPVGTAAVAADRLYAMGDFGAVVVFDVADPQAPAILGGGELGLDPERIAVGDGALLGVGAGVAALDVRDPTAVSAAGACPMPSVWARHLAWGPRGLFATEGDGIWHWPEGVAADGPCSRRFEAGGFGLGPVAVAGMRGFAAEWGVSPAAVRGLDLADADGPRLGGRSEDLPALLDLTAEGTHAFALSERGLHVIDGRAIEEPRLVASVELLQGGRVWGDGAVAVREGLLAAAGPELRLFDVSDPARPVALGGHAPTEARDLEIHGRLAFVSGRVGGGCARGGLHVLDVADPLSPRLVANDCWRTTGPLAVADAPPRLGPGSLVFVGDAAAHPHTVPGVWAYYVPPSGRVPVRLAHATLPADPEDLAISADGRTLWVADAAGGVFGYELSGALRGP